METSESCLECGTRRAVLRAGFMYCAECGLGAQHSQPVIDFSRDNFTGVRLTGKRNLHKKKNDAEACKLSIISFLIYGHSVLAEL